MDTMTTDKTAQQLLDALKWRYAVKKFDPSRKVDDGLIDSLEQALVLAASSYGMQAWRFVVVTDQAVKAAITEAAHGQTQPRDCSHLVVLCRNAELTDEHIDRYVARTAEVRHQSIDNLGAFSKMLKDFNHGPADKAIWMGNQVYIALGYLLTAAALLEVDGCPMEGFDRDKCDEILAKASPVYKGYKSMVLCPLGYRAADDKYASLAKVRFEQDQVILKV